MCDCEGVMCDGGSLRVTSTLQDMKLHNECSMHYA